MHETVRNGEDILEAVKLACHAYKKNTPEVCVWLELQLFFNFALLPVVSR